MLVTSVRVLLVARGPDGGAHWPGHGCQNLTWGREDAVPQPGLQEAVHRVLLQGVWARQHNLGTESRHAVAASVDKQV
jgi:hypothetical protein